jgi:hypothetical protein
MLRKFKVPVHSLADPLSNIIDLRIEAPETETNASMHRVITQP